MRVSFESRYGTCGRPSDVSDFITLPVPPGHCKVPSGARVGLGVLRVLKVFRVLRGLTEARERAVDVLRFDELPVLCEYCVRTDFVRTVSTV